MIQTFEHWILMKNKFPYDRYFTKSDMLVTKRHVPDDNLSEAEEAELMHLKHQVLCSDYDSIIEHMSLNKSIPEHTHLHLVEYKRPDGLPR